MVITATALCPREQHLGFFTSLYALGGLIGSSLMLGERYRSPPTDLVFGNLEVTHRCTEGIEPLGVARAALIQHVADIVVARGAEFVLFLDDDCVLTPPQFSRMLGRVASNVGCIGLQSTFEHMLIYLRGRPAFDFFCTLVPATYVRVAAGDEDLLALLRRLEGIGDSPIMDWWLRRHGCFLNVLEEPILHAWVRDEYKKWWDQDFHEESVIYEGIMVCKSLGEIEEFLEDKGVFL